MANPASSVVMGDAGEVVADGTAVARLTQWSVNPKISDSAWGDNDSAGYTNRKGARKDASGGIEGKFDSSNTPHSYTLDIGDEPSLVLWINTTLYWWFPCVLITNYQLTINMDSKEVVGWSADWGSAGIFSYPGQSGTASKSYPS